MRILFIIAILVLIALTAPHTTIAQQWTAFIGAILWAILDWAESTYRQ